MFNIETKEAHLHRPQPPHFVFCPFDPELDRVDDLFIFGIDATQRFWITRAVDLINKGHAQSAGFVKDMDTRRRHQFIFGKGLFGIVRGHKFAERSNKIEQQHDDRTNHGQPMAQKTPPHQLPIGGDIDLFLL